MYKLPFRQVHLDFHTSEAIAGIGSDFSKEQFQAALKLGHVNSITIFSKCHHGYAYHPTKANEMHPNLNFDLLQSMIDAAHEIDVKTPVYISAGLDEKIAKRHHDWLIRNIDGNFSWTSDFDSPGYHQLCFNTPYLDYLLKQIEEVVENYDADGIFLDIVGTRECYCDACKEKAKDLGYSLDDKKSLMKMWEDTYVNYANRVRESIDKFKPGLNVFHNGSHIKRGRRDLALLNSHIELESLPTGGWGYDHFPLSSRYVQGLGQEFLGMTGKFHLSWGEFGGFKHPNALKYETALSIANGAKCSIGDQLQPNGMMDMATYKLIGDAYSLVEKKEKYCDNTKNIADVALFSIEAIDDLKEGFNSDTGAIRMLLEGHYLFDVIDIEYDFSDYKVIILPDIIKINDELKSKLDIFTKNGGKILATGESNLDNNNNFVYDLGATYIEKNPYNPDYINPCFEIKNLLNSSYIVYMEGEKITTNNGGIELAKRENPYFNRVTEHFCSHRHTPNSHEYGGSGMTQGTDGIYISWKMFHDYATMGSLPIKEIVHYGLDLLLGDNKTICTNLPSYGVTTLAKQAKENRYVSHLLYAVPVKRGESVEVIEDIIPLYDINVTLTLNEKINSIKSIPSMKQIDFTQNGNKISFIVPKLDCHEMISIEY